MKKTKETREELQFMIGSAEQKIADYQWEDKKLRTQLSDILGDFYEAEKRYGGGREKIILSWLGISFEIGRLMEIKENLNKNRTIEELSREIDDLKSENRKLNFKNKRIIDDEECRQDY